VVTLFLAMAAVQFVITEHQPASSYLMPTQVGWVAGKMLAVAATALAPARTAFRMRPLLPVLLHCCLPATFFACCTNCEHRFVALLPLRSNW